jgi:hypothetical protein
MADEISEAVQIIRVTFEGMEIAMKIGSGGAAAAKKALDVIAGLLEYEKTIGRTGMRKLLMKGGDLQVFRFDKADRDRVEKYAKKFGILYSFLPNVSHEKDKMEFVFHTEAVPRMNLLIQKLKAGRIATFDEYLREDGGKNAGGLADFFLKEKERGKAQVRADGKDAAGDVLDGLIEKVGRYASGRNEVSVDQIKEDFSVSREKAMDVVTKLQRVGMLDREGSGGTHRVLMNREAFENRMRGYRELADRMKAVSKGRDPSLVDVTIAKSLIAEENDAAVKTRVPGTWGENARYLWVRKENAMDVYGGKVMLTFLEKDKDYKLYDDQNRVAEVKKGSQLYETNYNAVELGLRERYEKMRQEKERKEKAAANALGGKRELPPGRKA